MGFNLFHWLFGKESKPRKVDMQAVCYNLASEIYIRELALHMISNKIANAISKCEINIYEKGARKRNEEWYRWNIQPNKNQNATQFWHKLINFLFENNEAVVIDNDGELYVADNYSMNDDAAFYEHTFKDVTINSFIFQRTFTMSEVYYFKLNSENMQTFLNGTLQLYGKLINAAYSSYLVANGNKGILNIDQYAEQEEDFEETFNQILNEDFKKFFSNANAVMPLYNGYSYQQLENKGTQSTTRDFKALLDDVICLTADAYGMPKSIAIGEVQDTSKAIDEFLTFCIDPLIELLTDEINRKQYTKSQIIDNYFVKFDTKAIKHIDLLDVANAIDKLISSGCFTINDIRRVCGEDEIQEDWANQFFMTKNYSTIQNLMNQMKGGENGEK